jgi:hypothetical protein
MSGRVGFPEAPTPWMHSFEDLEKVCLDANKKVFKKKVVVERRSGKICDRLSRFVSEKKINLIVEVVQLIFRKDEFGNAKDQPKHEKTLAMIVDGIIETEKTRTISVFCNDSLYFPDLLTFDSFGLGKNLAIRVVSKKEFCNPSKSDSFYEDINEDQEGRTSHKGKWNISITEAD